MTKPLEALISRKGNSVTGNYYLAKCENCEEMFTSERMEGGEPLYSGDYSDCSCPSCGANDTEISDYGNDTAEAWNFQQKHIDALIAALEQSDKQCESWKQIAQTNISEREKDIAVLERKNNYIEKLREWNFGLAQESSVHQQRIAELESTLEREREKSRRVMSQLEASQLAVKLPAEFLTIGESLRTQDNRITSDPMFCIYQKEEIVVDAEYNHDRIVWWHSDGYEASANQARRLELLSDGLRDTGEWKRLAVKEINDFVTCCFTERGCKDYLAINGYNLRKPFICVKSGFRNNEYQAVRNWLMSVAGTVQGDE